MVHIHALSGSAIELHANPVASDALGSSGDWHQPQPDATFASLRAESATIYALVAEKDTALANKNAALAERDAALAAMRTEKDTAIAEKDATIAAMRCNHSSHAYREGCNHSSNESEKGIEFGKCGS